MSKQTFLAVAVIACAVGAAIGALGPWVQVTGPFGISLSVAGTEGDGTIVLVLAGMVLVLGALTAYSTSAGLALLLALACLALAGVGLWERNHVGDRLTAIMADEEFALASIGWGLNLITVAGIGAALFACWLFKVMQWSANDGLEPRAT